MFPLLAPSESLVSGLTLSRSKYDLSGIEVAQPKSSAESMTSFRSQHLELSLLKNKTITKGAEAIGLTIVGRLKDSMGLHL